MKAIITLECEGCTSGGLVFCPSIKNVILDLEEIAQKQDYHDIIKYIDSVTGIFDNPCNKRNVISNFMYKMHEYGIFDKAKYDNIMLFYNWHKRCGLLLDAAPKDGLNERNDK